MKQKIISKPSAALHGHIVVPGDKSISHRALMLASIAEGISEIKGLLMGADNLATLAAMRELGVEIEEIKPGDFKVHGVGLHGFKRPHKALDMGNSGTAMRLLTGLLSAQDFDTVLVGDGSLMKRPMERIVNPLQSMGAQIGMATNGTPPLQIRGKQKLHGIEYAMPIASAQVKSCLLLAGLYAQGKTTVIEPAPSRDHTERMLQAFHYPIQMHPRRVSLRGGHALQAAHIDIPADISSAAFFIVAASITPGSDVVLQSVGINPTRIGIINILKMMGANISYLNERMQGGEPVVDIRVCYAKLHGIEIPQEQVPLAIDEFPVLFIAAACAKGKTVLRGAKELRVKETDRIAAMADGLKKCGIQVETLEDGMVIEPGVLHGATVDSFGDHRIAMAFAVAGCVAKAPIEILDCENVQTSFPNFVELAKQIGFDI